MNLWQVGQQAARYATALAKHAADGFRQSSPDTIARRLSICQSCVHFNATGSCGICGCNCNNNPNSLVNKLAMASESCPLDPPLWGPETPRKPPRLTVGMATWRDFENTWHTVRSLSLHHPDVADELEILVVDSDPDFPDRHQNPDGARSPSERLRDLCNHVPQARYIVHDGPGGTAAPRNQVFTEARGEVVLCIDSHVLLPTGALRKTLDWFDQHPDFHGLVQGPMLYDNNEAVPCMAPFWGDGMLGQWANDHRYTGPDGEPFPITMHGLGLFGCRKSDWLGFNPHFRQFGGEEGYIHDKYRLAGREVLLLPWLQWAHQFRDPHVHAGYASSPRARIRNYVLGRVELGMDIDDIRRHFFVEGPRPGLVYRQEEWLQILEEVAEMTNGAATDQHG